jgi:hypothetical protein
MKKPEVENPVALSLEAFFLTANYVIHDSELK